MTSSPDPTRDQLAMTRSAQPTVLLDLPFTETDLPAVRRAVAAHADRTELPASRSRELVLIASELAANAIRHGGGKGRLLLWETPTGLSIQVSDHGPGLPEHHMMPEQRPEPTVPGGRGLWIVLSCADTFSLNNPAHGGALATATLHYPPQTMPEL